LLILSLNFVMVLYFSYSDELNLLAYY